MPKTVLLCHTLQHCAIYDAKKEDRIIYYKSCWLTKPLGCSTWWFIYCSIKAWDERSGTERTGTLLHLIVASSAFRLGVDCPQHVGRLGSRVWSNRTRHQIISLYYKIVGRKVSKSELMVKTNWFTEELEKIQRWEFVDLIQLVGGTDSSLASMVEGHFVTPRQKPPSTITDLATWQVYARLMAALLFEFSTSTEEAAGLAAHLHLVL